MWKCYSGKCLVCFGYDSLVISFPVTGGCMSNRLTINNCDIVRNKYIFRVLTSVQEMKLVVRKRMTLYPDARRVVFLCIFTFLAGMNKNLPSWHFSPLPLVFFVCDQSLATWINAVKQNDNVHHSHHIQGTRVTCQIPQTHTRYF